MADLIMFQATIQLRFVPAQDRLDPDGRPVPAPAIPEMTEDEAKLSLQDRIHMVMVDRVSKYTIGDQFPGWELAMVNYETIELGGENAV